MKPEGLRGRRALATTVAVACALVAGALASANGEEKANVREKVLGLDTVIHIYGIGNMRSATLISSGDWKGLKARGVVAAGRDGHGMLRMPVEQAAAKRNFGDNPDPVITIDEFGFDYDGQIDQRTAVVLRALKEANPNLHLAVWQMRGPVAPKLAAAYRDVVDLVMMESYVSPENIWLVGAQLKAAELNGLGDKSIIGIGLGRCPRDHVNWARTKEEVEEQLRFIRLVAPDSPGVAFFGQPGAHFEKGVPEVPLTLAETDELAGRFRQFPADGAGLRPELKELAEVFTRRYEKPAIVCSSIWIQPNFTVGHLGDDGKWTGWGQLAQPTSFRTPLLNLGEEDAKGVTVRVRNKGEDGKVWATGKVDIPARSVVVVSMAQHGQREGWISNWEIEVEAPGCDVIQFKWTDSLWTE